MEILDKKSNRMSRANAGVSECNEFPDLQRILNFYSLKNLASNELFFTSYSIFIINSYIFLFILFPNIIFREHYSFYTFNYYMKYHHMNFLDSIWCFSRNYKYSLWSYNNFLWNKIIIKFLYYVKRVNIILRDYSKIKTSILK